MENICSNCKFRSSVGFIKDRPSSCSLIAYEEKFTQLFACGNGESEQYGLVFLHYRCPQCGDFRPK